MAYTRLTGQRGKASKPAGLHHLPRAQVPFDSEGLLFLFERQLAAIERAHAGREGLALPTSAEAKEERRRRRAEAARAGHKRPRDEG